MIGKNSCLTVVVGSTCDMDASVGSASRYQMLWSAAHPVLGDPVNHLDVLTGVVSDLEARLKSFSLAGRTHHIAVEPFGCVLVAACCTAQSLRLLDANRKVIERDKVSLSALPDGQVSYLYVVDLVERRLNLYTTEVLQKAPMAAPVEHLQAGLWCRALDHVIARWDPSVQENAHKRCAEAVEKLTAVDWSFNEQLEVIGRTASASFHNATTALPKAKGPQGSSAYSW